MGESYEYCAKEARYKRVQIEWFIYLKYKKWKHNSMMSEVRVVVPLGLSEYLALFTFSNYFQGFYLCLVGKSWEKWTSANLCGLARQGELLKNTLPSPL